MEPCNGCGVDLSNSTVKFYLPDDNVASMYEHLVDAGLSAQAMLFFQTHSAAFDGYCTKCWVYDYIAKVVAYAPHDDEKAALIDMHLATTENVIGEEALWSRLGKPELN